MDPVMSLVLSAHAIWLHNSNYIYKFEGLNIIATGLIISC